MADAKDRRPVVAIRIGLGVFLLALVYPALHSKFGRWMLDICEVCVINESNQTMKSIEVIGLRDPASNRHQEYFRDLAPGESQLVMIRSKQFWTEAVTYSFSGQARFHNCPEMIYAGSIVGIRIGEGGWVHISLSHESRLPVSRFLA